MVVRLDVGRVNVSAIIVTRGNVDVWPVIESLPDEWEVVVWDNGALERQLHHPQFHHMRTCKPIDADLAVYGRYAAIEYATGDLIYVQDDDCVVSDPQRIVHEWEYDARTNEPYGPHRVVANMPHTFRHDFYDDHCLVGFGAVFHREAPKRAFGKFLEGSGSVWAAADFLMDDERRHWLRRTCDVVFTALTPRVLVNVPYENLPWATAEDRMYRQPEHIAERTRMLELARKVRDAG